MALSVSAQGGPRRNSGSQSDSKDDKEDDKEDKDDTNQDNGSEETVALVTSEILPGVASCATDDFYPVVHGDDFENDALTTGMQVTNVAYSEALSATITGGQLFGSQEEAEKTQYTCTATILVINALVISVKGT